MVVRRVLSVHAPAEKPRSAQSTSPIGRRFPMQKASWQRDQELLPEISLRLARLLRAGVPLELAIVQVDSDMASQHRHLATAAQHLSVGRRLRDVSTDWARNADSDAEHLLVGVLELGVSAGADLAIALDDVGEAIRDDVDHDRRRRILLTQSQMSAAVLVCLPLLFALIASLTRGFVYGDRLGFAFLAGGLLFDAIGVVWIRRLLRRLR